ncbi:hypothetical protein ASF61_21440 [Duganella sp. Leaf126]|uniref:hypothetical protein n=1 Tax=Duganella sp. Leaf126 TaxID=1736266 RepID=UPI0006FA7095|nr:hypothetical protein [Duganella sp. Leaf126]KQQ44695.1 hypothetical protein ASF61_21440 [Duganella sp. Leaf126]
MKKDPKMLTLRLDPDLRHWITAQKGLRNKTETYIATELMIQGLRAQTVDELVDSIRAAAGAGMQREILRQTLAMRYIVEAQARGVIRHPETLGTDAQAWASRELEAMFPTGEHHDH